MARCWAGAYPAVVRAAMAAFDFVEAIAVARTAAAADIAATIDAAERAMRAAEPSATAIYVEPDIYVEGHRTDPRPAAPEAAGH